MDGSGSFRYTVRMGKVSLSDILELSVAERIRLTQEIWDSILEFPESVRLTEEQRRMLDERIEDLARDPQAGSPWPEVKARILASK